MCKQITFESTFKASHEQIDFTNYTPNNNCSSFEALARNAQEAVVAVLTSGGVVSIGWHWMNAVFYSWNLRHYMASSSLCSLWNFAARFTRGKLESWGYPVVKFA